MNKPSSHLISIIFLLLAATAGNGQSQANVKGTWNMKVETSLGSGTPVFELKHVTDAILTGTYAGQLGQAEVKGTLKDKIIHLEFIANDNVIEYDGTVDGDTMKGKVRLGSMGEGTFTGIRKKS